MSQHCLRYYVEFPRGISTYDYYVDEELKDTIPYLYEKEFNKPYKDLSWWLEPKAKEFVKNLEDKWMHNQFDIGSIYRDYNFINWLKGFKLYDALAYFKICPDEYINVSY